jgi:2-succinyl-5-enolpyruvyl-6-hydroxy-3-cyclohexene-1-carboxylate synthase
VQAAFASVLVDEWLRAGLTDVVVCPGSRSTPLLVALAEAAERGALHLHVVLDERAAGFFALGLGLISGVPAPVVTTSGTAAVELHPAVVEAHHSGVPMIAVTADRPEELRDCGAPQSVHQVGLYGGAVRWEADLGVPDLAAAGSWRPVASRSVAEARGGARRPGPVHLNLAFREPLTGSAEVVLGRPAGGPVSGPGPGQPVREGGVAGGREPLGAGAELLAVLRDGRPAGAPWHRVAVPEEVLPPARVVEMLVAAGERGLIVAGPGSGSAEAVWLLSRSAGWPVVASPTSGCRLPGAVAAVDALLRCAPVRDWRPDIVLRLGAPWASKALNEWLAGLTCRQVLVDRWGAWAAPDRLPGEVVVASPEALCLAVAKAGVAVPSGAWASRWSLAETTAQSAIDAALLSEEGLTEPGTARTVVRALPSGSALVVSSSMPVRDVEWWTMARQDLLVLANRGANGIDGVLSTALGAAASRGVSGVTALLGDLAFLYDAGSLLRLAGDLVDLDVVVVDNDGGGIFNFLPQATVQPRERFERIWGTPHGADLVAIARGYGVEAHEVPGLDWLAGAIAGRSRAEGVRVFVARTPRGANVAVHQRLCSAVREAVVGLARYW